ncbi:proton channel OTOP1-like [Mixophyes fleayi]|uniref:proton channel OTOP1-like n=1 Tax=Mixophyes fleayi TaxID=3061075 RepID=UPI003F4D94CA
MWLDYDEEFQAKYDGQPSLLLGFKDFEVWLKDSQEARVGVLGTLSRRLAMQDRPGIPFSMGELVFAVQIFPHKPNMTNNFQHETVDGTLNNIPEDTMYVTDPIPNYILDDTIFPPPFIDDIIIEEHKHVRSKTTKNSEVASSQYGMNIFIVGLLLMLATYLNIFGLTGSDRLIFLIILMLIQVVWMIFYISIGDRKKWASTEKDGHAGARWLRCGIVLFAATTLVMQALKLGYFIGYSKCMSIIEGIYPVTHMVHTIFQVHFLWYHSKDVISSFKILERFGLIHSVFTNLLLWASAVATESDHQLEEHLGRLMSLGFENISIHKEHLTCNCTTELCEDFKKGIYYIYPFNIEYQVLASAMLYVLWKNIGNNIGHTNHKLKFKLQGVVPGFVLGLIVMTATIGIVVTYLLNIGVSKNNSESALSAYYFYSIAVLSFMCLASLIGLSIHKTDKKHVIKERSPSLKLDGDLLVGSAIGSWITSWGSILAIIFAEGHPTYTWYNLPYSILVIIEKYIQNLFIIKYINRQVDSDSELTDIEIPGIAGGVKVLAESTNFKTCNGNLAKKNHPVTEGRVERQKDSLNSTSKTQILKKALLKNITVALFLCNISLWIPIAFGCRPQYDNGLEAYVFGFVPWIIVIEIALPFSIFYRMHSTYSLFDVYCKI